MVMEWKAAGWREVRTAAALGEVRQENPALVCEKTGWSWSWQELAWAADC